MKVVEDPSQMDSEIELLEVSSPAVFQVDP